MIQTNFNYAPLDLGIFETFEEKLNILTHYLEINRIFCQLPDDQIPEKSPDDTYTVVEIVVPGGMPSYIKHLLQECISSLQIAIDEYVANHDDYFSIKKCLQDSMDKCDHLQKKYDINKSLPYNENEISHVAKHNDQWMHLYKGQIEYDQFVADMFIDHYSIRKEFFEEMSEMIKKKITEHLEIPSYSQKSYKWNSENPHLEIAELLISLLHKRIKIEAGSKGSTSKLVKEFYNLFGLDDGLFHQKSQQIRNRQNKSSWLQELPDEINSLQKRNDATK